MSYGLQVFSPSGKPLLDTTKGALLLLDHIRLTATWSGASGYYYSATYPSMKDQAITYQVIAPGLSYIGVSYRYPNITITNTNGVPGISITPSSGSFDLGNFVILVYALPTIASISSYGIQLTSSIDGRQMLAEDTKLLRFRGMLAPSSSSAFAGGTLRHTYNVNSLGIGTSEPPPLAFVEIGIGKYATVENLDAYTPQGGSPTWYCTVASSGGFYPKIYLFSHDYLDQAPVDNAYGMIIKGPSGQTVFHSGIDHKILQTYGGLPYITTPEPLGSLSYTVSLPTTVAVPYYTRGWYYEGPDYVYYSAMARTATGVTVGWIKTYTGWVWTPPNYANGRMAFIDVNAYQTL